nr:MAG TPA: hypothetical protein [Caudoviricetes sp.]
MGSNKIDLTKDTIYTHPYSIQCDASSEINSLKSSVSSGKQLVASAVTGKGVSTAADASFQTIANNINGINTKTPFESKLIDLVYFNQLETAENDYISGLPSSLYCSYSSAFRNDGTFTLNWEQSGYTGAAAGIYCAYNNRYSFTMCIVLSMDGHQRYTMSQYDYRNKWYSVFSDVTYTTLSQTSNTATFRISGHLADYIGTTEDNAVNCAKEYVQWDVSIYTTNLTIARSVGLKLTENSTSDCYYIPK